MQRRILILLRRIAERILRIRKVFRELRLSIARNNRIAQDIRDSLRLRRQHRRLVHNADAL